MVIVTISCKAINVNAAMKAWHGMVWHGIARHGMVWHGAVPGYDAENELMGGGRVA